ncbi:MAG: hypothetical protein KGJ78_16270 [Alphaproteobacteria bacterium]|nr:hypothetical protein [Alphaproteobacteria bacterium]
MNIHSRIAKKPAGRQRSTSVKEQVRRLLEAKGEKAARAKNGKKPALGKRLGRKARPSHLSIRDLQKISGETIAALPGPTPVKSGDRTVAILVPLKPNNVAGMKAVLAWAEELAKGRDPKADDEALRQFGDVDPTDWNEEAVRRIQAEVR